MNAAIYDRYGPPDVLHLADVEKPQPQENEILIRIRATSVNFGDLLARDFAGAYPKRFHMPFVLYLPARLFFGWSRPKVKVLGSELAGEVEAVGAGVTNFKPGDEVFGYPGQSMGAYAEYIVMKADGMVATMPDNVSFEEAAVMPYGGIVAQNLLKQVDLGPGKSILINGASGSIGAAAVQIARHLGAEVTGVCGASRMDFVKSRGAGRVIDYRQQDFTQDAQTYDVVFDVLGKSDFDQAKKVLKLGGIYLRASFKMKQVGQMLWTKFFGDRKVVCALSQENPENLETLKALVASGAYRAEVDKSFPLAQAAEAHAYAESADRRGPVAITVA
jgi:NADPH:quinone reductase-like Zn-dependent oxidoreductase